MVKNKDTDMDNLNKDLKTFSNLLIPSDDFLKLGNETVDRIFRLLKSSKKFSVDRVKIVGSIGKKTAIFVDPDFDLVVFINDQHPYFTDVLNNFEDILTLTDDIKNIKVTKFSIQFNVNNIAFDLLPGTNFVTMNPQPGGNILAKMQAEGALEYIRRNPKDGYKYGSAVSEQTIEFFRDQTPFVHEMVRLVKFWNKTLHIGTYITGRSSLIELIGIHAGRIQEAQGEKSHLKCFRIFLMLMTGFNSLDIKFYHFYSEQQIPDNVKTQRPLVLDPVNPYNNFAWFIPSERNKIIQTFKAFSNETWIRLNDRTKSNILFEVQPKVLTGPRPDKWLVSICDKHLVNPTMKVRVDDKEFKSMNWGVNGIQQCLSTTMAALTLRDKNVEKIEVQSRVESCVDMNIMGKPIQWVESTEKHDSYNVTLSIPIPNNSKSCIQVSFS